MNEANRRQLLLGAAGAGLLAFACSSKESDEDVAPPEDLMREHGALNRVLLIYEECARRLGNGGQPPPVDALAKSAEIIKRFIENYHEKLEEDFLFPRFERANKLVDLVKTLRAQHAAGRTLTDAILQGATSDALAKDDGRQRVVDALRSFIHMYRPHEAREDTILFPALRSVVSSKEFHELGEQFEDKEHELFGKEGFEGVVGQIEGIEKGLGLYDLSQFTPVSRG